MLLRHVREVNLQILTSICVAENMFFMVATMASKMERDLIRERTPGGVAPGRVRIDARSEWSSRASSRMEFW